MTTQTETKVEVVLQSADAFASASPVETVKQQIVQPAQIAQATQTTNANVDDDSFDDNLIRKYPRSNRKVTITVSAYSLVTGEENGDNSQSIHISPHGMEFHAHRAYPEGTLLKIHVALPDYWRRKQRYVEYRRIDQPHNFKILAKVVKTEDVGKRGKKKLITVQTVNMDEVDEQVLKTFLQEG